MTTKHSNKKKRSKKVQTPLVDNVSDLGRSENSSSVIMVLLKIMLMFLLTFFTAFVIWQFFITEARSFVSFLPKEATDLALEIKIDQEISSNVMFKKWLYGLIFTDDVLSSFPEDKVRDFLNGRYKLGLARIDKNFIVGIRPIDYSRESFVSILRSNVVNIDHENSIVEIFINDKSYYLTYFDEYITFSTSKELLSRLIRNTESANNLAFQGLSNYGFWGNLFLDHNLIYLKPKEFVLSLLNEVSLAEDISLGDFYSGDDIVDSYIGNFDIRRGVFSVKFRKQNYMLDNQNDFFDTTKYLSNSVNICPIQDYYAKFSGYDFSMNWKDFNTNLVNTEYSILGTLSYKFIRDILEKTEFDIEEEIILNINKFYCMSLHRASLDEEGGYVIAFKNDGSIDTKELFRRLEYVYIRYAPLMKPIVREYLLPDNTKAREYIVDSEQQIVKAKVDDKDIYTIRMKDSNYSELSFGTLEDLVFISNSEERLINAYKSFEVLSSDLETKYYEQRTEIIPIELINEKLMGPYLSDDMNEKLNDLFDGIKEVVFSRDNIGDIDIEVKL